MVESDFEPLKSRVEMVLELAMTTVDSLSTLFVAPSRENQLMSLIAGVEKAITAGTGAPDVKTEIADEDMADAPLR